MLLLQYETEAISVWEQLATDQLFWTLYVPIAAYMLIIIVLFFYLMKKYTFGNWTPENPNPYEKETLGFPRGFFRGILTISLLFATLLFYITNIRTGSDETNINGFVTAFQMMIAFYFGSKVLHHITSVERSKAEYRSTSFQNSPQDIEREMEQKYRSEIEDSDENDIARG